MQVVEDVTRRIAIGCAVVLLFGPFGGRTVWVSGTAQVADGMTKIVDAAGYNAASVLSGLVVLAALAGAHSARPGVVLPVLGAVAAVAAFALTVFYAGVYVVAQRQGGVWDYGGGIYREPDAGWTVYPAPGPPLFALAALVGAIASLALAVAWLRPPSGDVYPRPAWMSSTPTTER